MGDFLSTIRSFGLPNNPNDPTPNFDANQLFTGTPYDPNFLPDLSGSGLNTSALPWAKSPTVLAPTGGTASTTPALAGAATPTLGWNMDTAKMGLAGIQTLGNLWNAWQQSSIARDQLNFTKKIGNANLLNQIKSYNTSLSDKALARGAMEGLSTAQSQAYIDANKLSK